jgi:hypothetical protein
MAQLAEAYVHLKPFYISAERLEQLGEATDTLARIAAQRIYKRLVEIEVELREGTLWGTIKVTGAILLTVYTAGSSYKGLFDSVELACSQAREFGRDVCGAFIKESGATNEQVARKEHRLKTPGKLLRALQTIERLDNSARTLSEMQLDSRLHRARVELEAAISDLDLQELALLENGLRFKNLPPLKTWPEKETPVADVPRIAREVDVMDSERKKRLVAGESGRVPPEQMRPLHYYNKFEVLPAASERNRSSGGRLKH